MGLHFAILRDRMSTAALHSVASSYGVRPWTYWTGRDDWTAGSVAFDIAVCWIGLEEQRKAIEDGK